MVLSKQCAFIFAIASALGCWGTEATMAGAVTQITIHYLPFSVETFLPVTIDSLEKDARCVFSFEASPEDTTNLHRWFANVTKGDFDKKRVRLMLAGLEDARLYVDAEGGLRRGSSGVGKLNEHAFKALEQFVEAAALRAGCDPHD